MLGPRIDLVLDRNAVPEREKCGWISLFPEPTRSAWFHGRTKRSPPDATRTMEAGVT